MALRVISKCPGTSQDTVTSRAPFEGELAALTLWPEVEKVFGHGYEVNTTRPNHIVHIDQFPSLSASPCLALAI